MLQIINSSGDGNAHENLSYQYDPWGNIKEQLLNRDNNVGSEIAEETFIYDSLHRLKSASVNGDTAKTYAYNGIGNITSKSDFSDNGYNYGAGTAGPNAVTSASLINGSTISYEYDKKGNRISDSINGSDTATYQYDYNNLLVESTSEITGKSQILEFNYGADNQRYRKYDLINKEITLYANKDYEAIYKGGAYFPTETKYYLTSYLTVTRKPSGEVKRNFMQKDRLGSTTQILDETGIVLHTKSYDAFGKPRNGDWSDMAGGLFKAKLDFDDANGTIDLTKRGFTDHEHLDEMQLIHMNGRMYDYNNGRFLSVDPFITNPSSTQAMNPYTYIFNNPLSGIDPSGYAPIAVDSINCRDNPGECAAFLSGGIATGQKGNGKDGDGNSGTQTSLSDTGSQTSVVSNAQKNPKKESKEKLLKATQAQINAFRQLSKEKVENLNPDKTDPNKETKFQMDGKGNVSDVTQEGCDGGDTCGWYPSEFGSNTTLLGHTHTDAPSGGSTGSAIRGSRTAGNNMSRNAPGPGDTAPLTASYVSGILTVDGYQFIISGSVANPIVTYLGGGSNSGWGQYVEQNWTPNNKAIIRMSRDFINIQRKERKAAKKAAKRQKRLNKQREKL